jgi:coenzyme Q-binding protein COQ10
VSPSTCSSLLLLSGLNAVLRPCRYTQEQLYNIVADVPSYSQFIPFCASSSVITSSTSATPAQRLPTRQEPFDVEAELQVGFGNFSEKYTSRVQGIPFESVTVRDDA